ncbi:MAG: flavin reductase family protein [Phycisphaerae bacterium]|jgi:flavin reductase (DIM6/NTAB) family NADH-FMN oxidoreductase RutF
MQIPSDFDTAIRRKYPEGVAIVIAKDPDGKHNPITLCWVMRTSLDPPMLAISIGLARHSLSAIRHAREFVVAILASDMAEDALFHGTKSGRDLDKLAAAGTKIQPATVIDSVLLADAVANFECRVEGELHTGDHVIFAGRVVAAHQSTNPEARGLYALGNDQFGGVVAR